MSFYLAFKEMWRSRGRYLLIAMIVALITTLVLFIAALSEGLASANREYIEKLNGELLVFQSGTELSTTASRIGRSRLNELRRVPGVQDVGQVGFATAKVAQADGKDDLDVALIGVEPNRPGEPPVIEGRQLERDSSNDVIVDTGVTDRLGLGVGDTIRIKVTQGTDEEFYDLNIVGVTDRRQYFFQPAIFAPLADLGQGQAAGHREQPPRRTGFQYRRRQAAESGRSGSSGQENRGTGRQGGRGGSQDCLGSNSWLCGAAEHA